MGPPAVVFALALLFCIFSTRRYQAMGTIQVQKESSDGLDLESLMGSGSDSTDALNADINIQTQASILQSNALALRTIEKLGLENTGVSSQPESPGQLVGTLFPAEDSSESDRTRW